MGNHHHHKPLEPDPAGDRHITWAVGVNVLLTVAQIVAGVLAGSLALIADALHNFGDAATLGMALFARKIARKPADNCKTFGYLRAEIIVALVNLTTLIILGIYLIYEALWRLVDPQAIEGDVVIAMALVALTVDVVTALVTHPMAKDSMNMRAAFLHNLTDALASIGVLAAGVLMALYGWYWTDAVFTLLIAGYVLYQGIKAYPPTVHILMQGVPPHIEPPVVIAAMKTVQGVQSVHHMHMWQLDEHNNMLEAHVVIGREHLEEIERVKGELKVLLRTHYNITHSSLEIELPNEECGDCIVS